MNHNAHKDTSSNLILVIGGGLIGAVVAFYLQKAGYLVRVLDANLDGAAWRAGAGMLTPSGEDLHNGPLWQIAQTSLQLWPQLSSDLANKVYYRTGLEHWQNGTWQIAPLEGLVHPPSVVAAALQGLDVRHERAISIDSSDDSIYVHSEQINQQQITHKATLAILAAGVWSKQFGIAVQPILGRALLLEDPTGSNNFARHAGNSQYALKRPDGLYVGATSANWQLGQRIKSISHNELSQLLQIKNQLLNPSSVLLSTLAGLRPISNNPNGLPIIEPHPQHCRLLVATGHGRHGALLAPYTAQRVVAWVNSSLAKADQSNLAPTPL